MTTGVPEFPVFAAISLDMRDHVASAFEALQPEISEFTFGNLFLFRKAHDYLITRRGGFLLITGKGYDHAPYGFPPIGTGDPTEAALVLCDLLARKGSRPVLYPVPKEWVDRYFDGPEWRVSPDRNSFDYVYLREELATLQGNKFHKRRNRLQKFLREEAADYSYQVLTSEHGPDCLRLAEGWCDIRCSVDRPSTFLETEAAREAVRCRDSLGLRGGAIVLNGRVQAFCLGERLNRATFVVHFEKSEPGREGLAQLINRDFCLRGLQEYDYLNREQDLGDPGLRQAKESYHPALLVEKYRVEPV